MDLPTWFRVNQLNIIDYLFIAYWVKLYEIEIEVNPIGVIYHIVTKGEEI